MNDFSECSPGLVVGNKQDPVPILLRETGTSHHCLLQSLIWASRVKQCSFTPSDLGQPWLLVRGGCCFTHSAIYY